MVAECETTCEKEKHLEVTVKAYELGKRKVTFDIAFIF